MGVPAEKELGGPVLEEARISLKHGLTCLALSLLMCKQGLSTHPMNESLQAFSVKYRMHNTGWPSLKMTKKRAGCRSKETKDR